MKDTLRPILLAATLLAGAGHGFAQNDPFFAPNPYVQAVAAFERGDMATAENLVEPLAQVAKPSADTCALLGRIRQSQKRWSEATRWLEQAVAAKPGNAPLLTFLGLALLDQANAGEGPQQADLARGALARLMQAQALAPDYLDAHMALVRYHLTAPSGRDAAQAWSQAAVAAQLDPGSAPYDIAELAERAGDLPLAEKYYRASVTAFPEEPWLHWSVARVQVARGAIDEARAGLQKLLQAFPGFGPAQEALAKLPPPPAK